MGIDLNNPEPLYRQISNDIKAKIAAGTLKTGDQLASQNELADEYDVSLITIKKALADLAKEGVVYSRVGKGTYVANQETHVDFAKSKTIGFVLRDLESPFFSRILSSVEKTLAEKEYNLLLSSTAGKTDKEESIIKHFLQIGVSGLIIASMSRENYASPVIRKLQEENYPYVFVSYIADEDISYVGTDHEEGAFVAVRHLLKLGYSKIGYINGESGSLLGELRKKGLLRALNMSDIQFNPDFEYRLKLRGEWHDFQSGYEIGAEFVNSTDRPEAIFAYNDLSALGFQKAILENGLSIPDDVALVGFDNIKRGALAAVPLTTINQPAEEIGELAVEMVVRKIRNEPVNSRQILKPELIVRDSCGAGIKSSSIM